MQQISRLFEIPYYQLENHPLNNCFSYKENGKWLSISTKEYVDTANKVSRCLLKEGIQKNDKIAMISNNRYEWNIMDIGMLQVGAINVPVYPTISAEDFVYIFNHAEVKICFVSDEELFNKISSVKDQIPTLQKIFTFNKVDGAAHWSVFLEQDDESLQAEVDLAKLNVSEEDLATLIYTSGTTGRPKGVMLSHKNLVSNTKMCVPRIPVVPGDKALSFLPICHVFERTLLYLYQHEGICIYFAESLDTIGNDMKEVNPHFFTAVPRLLEKVYDKIIAKGTELKGIKKALFFWAVNLGLEYDVKGKSSWYHFQLKIARKLIFSKWKEALGGNVKAIASGSAALQVRLSRIFIAADLPIMEGYGLTETSPVLTVNCMDDDGIRIGTTGRTLEGVEIKIAEDGEILARGANIMMGYFKDEEKTKEVIDSDNWFHTGDIGEMVEGEFLKITDRKKEMFKTSGGKYIAPQYMENKFKESRFIEQIMVIGEFKKHPAALIIPDFDYLSDWCKIKGLQFTSKEEMIQSEKIINRYMKEFEEMNESFSQWERVKKFKLISSPWSVETGELTPTLKLKRKVVKQKFANLIDEIYC